MTKRLTHKQAAERLGIKSKRLYAWRVDGYGPRWEKPDKNVYYNSADIDQWLADREAKKKPKPVKPPEPRWIEGTLANHQFPKTRAECKDGPRPCPWFRCRHHAIWSMSNYQIGRMDDEAIIKWCDTRRCTLDIMDETENLTCQAIGDIFGTTRERVRQLEGENATSSKTMGALYKLQRAARHGAFQGAREAIE